MSKDKIDIAELKGAAGRTIGNNKKVARTAAMRKFITILNEAAGKGGGEDRLSADGAGFNLVRYPLSCDSVASLVPRGTKP